MATMFDSVFSSVVLGHMMVDLLNGSRPVLLAFLSTPLNLSNTGLATISTIYVWTASISQPFFGWLTDRIGPRWTASGGLLWMAGFFALAMILDGNLALFCLILASLGSAALHPAGAMQATLHGQTRMKGRETTAASMFFFFGQLGLFIGPILTGPLLDHFGTLGMLIPAAFVIPIGLNAAYQLRVVDKPHKASSNTEHTRPTLTVSLGFIALLTLVASTQAWVQQNMVTFVPKYLADLGQSASIYGLLAGLFMGGSAIGNVVGGMLADRYGKIRVASTALILASIPLFTISQVGWSKWLYLLIPFSGALTGSVHSILVVMAQRTLRGGMALASGLILGIMFSAGALGTLLTGPLADTYGFPLIFQLTSGLALVAAILLNLLKRSPQLQVVSA